MKEEGPQFELLQDIVNIILTSIMTQDPPLIEKHEMQHVNHDKKTGRWSVDKLHMSLIVSSWGQNKLMKIHGRRDFIGKEIIEKDLDKL